MSRDRSFNAITIRGVEHSDITTSWSDLGDALTQLLYIMTVKNTTDSIVYISENASDIHYELAPGEHETYDFQSNRAGSVGAKRIGLQFSVKKASSTTCGRVILGGQTL